MSARWLSHFTVSLFRPLIVQFIFRRPLSLPAWHRTRSVGLARLSSAAGCCAWSSSSIIPSLSPVVVLCHWLFADLRSASVVELRRWGRKVDVDQGTRGGERRPLEEPCSPRCPTLCLATSTFFFFFFSSRPRSMRRAVPDLYIRITRGLNEADGTNSCFMAKLANCWESGPARVGPQPSPPTRS